MEEIKLVVWDCESSKAPGPDGFNFGFIKKCWNMVSSDIVQMVKSFHENGLLPHGPNNSFVTLIPKESSTLTLKNFTPISLVGCLYKIIAKCLSNRLKKFISEVFGVEQRVFFRGRQILDIFIVANELIHHLHCSK